tara:strand:- start:330 stop:1271 length:942 start_codon:yes stop_codon:yes gene_type:complete
MKIILYKNFKIKKKHKNSILLIGNFDGLHLGHQKLFKLAKTYKREKKLKIGVITFNPIPKMFFNKKLKNFRISNFNQQINFFKKYDVDFVILKKFNKEFSRVKYDKFISRILFTNLKTKYIFVSSNFKFGNKRKGNVKILKKLEKKYNYRIINPKPLTKNNKIVSSTLIRKFLSLGKLNRANFLLNRNWSMEGIVRKGRMMGRKIGFPTANINLNNYILPALGVYAVRAYLGNSKKSLKGVANIGYRPTFKQKKILLEVNLFNFNKIIYNKKLTVEFLKFIRKEKKFNGINELRKQIKFDLIKAKKVKQAKYE